MRWLLLVLFQSLYSLSFENAPFSYSSYLTHLSLRSTDIYHARTISDEEALNIFHLKKSAFTKGIVCLMKEQNVIIGFYALRRFRNDQTYLTHFFLEPAFIGRGYGKIMFFHAMQTASHLGWKSVLWVSDPHARGFYEKMGAQQIGEVPYRMNPILISPVFIYHINRN